MSDQNEEPALSPFIMWIVVGLAVVIVLWTATYAAGVETRLSLQAAGDAVAAIAAIASVVATLLVLEQLKAQRRQIKLEHDARLAQRNHAKLDELATAYAEWGAAQMASIWAQQDQSRTHLMDANNRVHAAVAKLQILEWSQERIDVISPISI